MTVVSVTSVPASVSPVSRAGPRGLQGKSLELRESDGYLQWRVVGDPSWTNLLPLTDIAGPALDLQATGTAIQWRVHGTLSWADLVLLSAIYGPAPVLTVGTITTGAPGSSVDFDLTQTSAGHYTIDVTIPAGHDGVGNVTGAASSIDGEIALFSGTNGKLLKALGIKFGTGANNAVQLGSDGKLPVIDGSKLTNLAYAMPRSARTSNTAITTTDRASWITLTGSFTQAFVAVATLGSNSWGIIENAGTGDILLDPNGSEQIDGLASYPMYPGEVRLWHCDGAALHTIVLQGYLKDFTTSGTWTKSPGYSEFEVETLGSGAGGGAGARGGVSTVRGGGGGGGGGGRDVRRHLASDLGSSETVLIGAAGIGGARVMADGASGADGTGGDVTSFGSWQSSSGGLKGGGGLSGSLGTGAGGAGGSGLVGLSDAAGVHTAATTVGASLRNDGGAAGGTCDPSSGGGKPGGGSLRGGAGGGAGGSIDSADVAQAAGAGGSDRAASGGGGAAGAAAPTNTGPGGAGTAGSSRQGGGGGAPAGTISGAGGDGGKGGLGAGGGGGGASVNGSPSGKGGDGGGGRCRVRGII